ncbi:hypothetical protein EUTSA_v10006396mg [Eutrema salsugineum]|uniref:Mitochondrial transcription termination factor family protein n=1 Tax=Eutrema salsugineum TaxID=72664 RepID=V4NCR4_EUTSA|nr:transcription termination factor MTERF6, chloroplastic/mitochondrial [Eutrema salsugineum]ESQ43781.1 hypothetical protein EUTSA_v10006396mg [Eutrema salsugineum]
MSRLLYCRRLSFRSWVPIDFGESRKLGFLLSGRRLCSVSDRKAEDAKTKRPSFKSFTVSYLVNSCGLSLESAKSKSRFVKLSSSQRPNSVLTLLKNNGFTSEQITRVVKSFPSILIVNPEAVLSPKLMFFRSIGLSSSETAKLISNCPTTLSLSLNNRLIPCYDSLKSILVDQDNILKCLRRGYWIFTLDTAKYLATRLSLCRHLGVRDQSIKRLVQNGPLVFFCSERKFNEVLTRVCSFGFDPKKMYFIHAMLVLFHVSESALEHKFELYQQFGWSRTDFVAAFMRFPNCVKISDEKINGTMDYLVNNAGLQPRAIAMQPFVLGLSLEKRIKPRNMVISELLSKGFVKKEDLNYFQILKIKECMFLDKFVVKFQQVSSPQPST